jgi:hypothetical protein
MSQEKLKGTKGTVANVEGILNRLKTGKRTFLKGHFDKKNPDGENIEVDLTYGQIEERYNKLLEQAPHIHFSCREEEVFLHIGDYKWRVDEKYPQNVLQVIRDRVRQYATR